MCDKIALNEFSAVQVSLHGLTHRPIIGVGIERGPFAV
jgi:hypothetical protein